MNFENNKSGNGGVITLNKEDEEVGRLTYTIFPEENKLIISFVRQVRFEPSSRENPCYLEHLKEPL